MRKEPINPALERFLLTFMPENRQSCAVQRANAHNECERDLDSKIQRCCGPLNTRQTHSLRGTVILAIAPSRCKNRAGKFSNPSNRIAGVIRDRSPTTATEEAMKEPLWQNLGARGETVPSLGSGRDLLKRAGQRNRASWKVSGNRFDDCKSEPSLSCEQDSRLWSIPNAERRVTTKPSKPANLQGFGGLGGFCFNQCVLHQTVFGE